MKSSIPLFILLIVCLNFLSEARRGCCSHHGGVCGCGCCDGTPLSAKCAPYYDCSSKTKSNYQPQKSNKEVIQVQNGLKKLGYYNGVIDGISGEKTRAAVRLFQRQNGIVATGDVNSVTLQYIIAAVKKLNE